MIVLYLFIAERQNCFKISEIPGLTRTMLAARNRFNPTQTELFFIVYLFRPLLTCLKTGLCISRDLLVSKLITWSYFWGLVIGYMKGAWIAYVQLRVNMIMESRVQDRKEEIIKPLREHVNISPLMVPISTINCEEYFKEVNCPFMWVFETCIYFDAKQASLLHVNCPEPVGVDFFCKSNVFQK